MFGSPTLGFKANLIGLTALELAYWTKTQLPVMITIMTQTGELAVISKACAIVRIVVESIFLALDKFLEVIVRRTLEAAMGAMTPTGPPVIAHG